MIRNIVELFTQFMAGDPFYDAVKLYDSGNRLESLNKFEEIAGSSFPEVEYNIAVIRGEILEK